MATDTLPLSAPPAANGVVPHAVEGPRAVRRIVTVAVPEPPSDDPSYAGFSFSVWLNFPQAVMREIQSGDSERTMRAMRRLVLAHNGWRDFDGVPYPPATDDAFWEGERAIPSDLLAYVIEGLTEAINRSPLARRTPPASASGSAPATSGA